LLPQELYRHAVEEDDAGLARFGITDCIECGCCDAVCPSQLPLVSVFGAARRQLQVNTVTTERRDLARQRFNAHTQRRAVEQAERQRRLKERRPAGRKDE
jgi:electron transport complex protein RnfC